MAVTIGMASIDENGKITGGKKGDQTGREILTRTWYLKGWDVFIKCKDTRIAEKAAEYMAAICANDNFGYSQTARWTGYDSIKADGIQNAKGDFDCSSLVTACYALAGVNFSYMRGIFTGNMKQAFKETGLFEIYTDKDHCQTSQYAVKGALYLNQDNHVVMALTNGTKADTNETGGNNTVNVELPIIKQGSKGEAVKTIQRLLNALGYGDQNRAALKVDGDAGVKTIYALRLFQNDNRAACGSVDGICGAKTWRAILT